MTTLERLSESGLLESFDAAIRAKHKELAVSVLERVQLPRSEADAIVKRILEKPEYYGY